MTVSSAVPETTPSWPVSDTARANRQSETATPIPPWIKTGSSFCMACIIESALHKLRGIFPALGKLRADVPPNTGTRKSEETRANRPPNARNRQAGHQQEVLPAGTRASHRSVARRQLIRNVPEQKREHQRGTTQSCRSCATRNHEAGRARFRRNDPPPSLAEGRRGGTRHRDGGPRPDRAAAIGSTGHSPPTWARNTTQSSQDDHTQPDLGGGDVSLRPLALIGGCGHVDSEKAPPPFWRACGDRSPEIRAGV